jgi:hypothetical protein
MQTGLEKEIGYTLVLDIIGVGTISFFSNCSFPVAHVSCLFPCSTALCVLAGTHRLLRSSFPDL